MCLLLVNLSKAHNTDGSRTECRYVIYDIPVPTYIVSDPYSIESGSLMIYTLPTNMLTHCYRLATELPDSELRKTLWSLVAFPKLKRQVGLSDRSVRRIYIVGKGEL